MHAKLCFSYPVKPSTSPTHRFGREVGGMKIFGWIALLKGRGGVAVYPIRALGRSLFSVDAKQREETHRLELGGLPICKSDR